MPPAPATPAFLTPDPPPIPATPATSATPATDHNARVGHLVRAARTGSGDAIGELVTEFSPLLWQVARAAGLSATDAEDVVQTVWLRLLEHLDGIRAPSALAAWLVTTTRREAWRSRAAGRRQVPSEQDWLVAMPDPQPSAEELAVADDQRRELFDALSKLSPRCQELLRILAFIPRPDYDILGAKLGMPHGSIGPTRGRCLAKLRALLAGTVERTAQ